MKLPLPDFNIKICYNILRPRKDNTEETGKVKMMIISKEVRVKIAASNKKYYISKGYNAIYGQELIVKIEDLTTGSNAKVTLKCDYCGKEYEVRYADFCRNKLKEQIHKEVCASCRMLKTKEIMQSKYNVDHNSKLSFVIESRKQTCMNKYGVDNYAKTPESIAKVKQTNLQKYGVLNPMQVPEFKEKNLFTKNQNGTAHAST